MLKHTQAIRRQFTHELFECAWPFCDIGAQRVKLCAKRNPNLKIEAYYRRKDISEAVVPSCSVKEVFSKISENSKENTCARWALKWTHQQFILDIQFISKSMAANVSYVCFRKKFSLVQFWDDYVTVL